MHRITIKQLAVFVAVAKENSVTLAANRIGLSQAAVSQGLTDIEHLLNRRLFDRVGRRLVLNTEGKALLPLATEILERVSTIEAPENTSYFFLRFGTSQAIVRHRLTPLINAFLQEKPHGHIHVDIDNSTPIANALLHFDLDAAFIEGKNYDSELLTMPWQEDRLVIIASPCHPFAKTPIRPDQLSDADWILSKRGSGCREAFEQAILPHFQANRIRLEISDHESICTAVKEGLGLACVSAIGVEEALNQGKLIALDLPWLKLQQTINLVVHRQKHLGKPLLLFLQRCGISTDSLLAQLTHV